MSKEFVDKIKNIQLKKESFAIIFMGQAGFIIKDSEGLLYAIDVYFTDCCEREFGFKRLIPKLLDPDEIIFDYVLTTHAHYDHFDIDAMPILMSNGHTSLYTTKDGVEECKKLSIKNVTEISEGNSYKIGNINLNTVFCDHGELAPYAVGFLIEIYGKKIYLTGDTTYRPERAKLMKKENIDIMFLPINGAFGNLNEEEAIEYVKLIEPKTVMPCHYGNFKEHGGDVNIFNALFEKNILQCINKNMNIGDIIFLHNKKQ